jgi:phosphoribosylformylglycinamidine synthase
VRLDADPGVSAVDEPVPSGEAALAGESVLSGGLGVRVRLDGDPFVALFSETPARAIVSLAPDSVADFRALAASGDVPVAEIGTVTDDGLLTVEGCFAIPLAELRERWRRTIPEVMAPDSQPAVPGTDTGIGE